MTRLGQSETSPPELASLLNRLAALEARVAALEGRAGATLVGRSLDPNPSPPLGKDALCSYCGGALWVCRGAHNVC